MPLDIHIAIASTMWWETVGEAPASADRKESKISVLKKFT